MYSLYILLLGGDIQCQGTAKEPAVIYGNGINMIEIIVKAKIMDKIPEKIPVEMTKDEIKKVFYCHSLSDLYYTGYVYSIIIITHSVYHQTNRKTDTGKTLTQRPVFFGHFRNTIPNHLW